MAQNPTTTATPVTMPPLATEPLSNQLAALSQELAGDLQINLIGPVEQQVQQAMRELDVTDTNSIIFFGSKAQQQLTTISDTMLENVRTKDMGPAGNALNAMVAKLREIDISDVDPDRPAGLLRPAVRREERGAEVPRQVRGRARPDRHASRRSSSSTRPRC